MRDDFLGQTFVAGSHAAQTIPYVELHLKLARLAESGAITAEQSECIDECFAAMHFSERTYPGLRKRLVEDYDGAEAVLPQLEHAFLRMDSPKRIDGMELLERVKRDLAEIAERNARLVRGQPSRVPSSDVRVGATSRSASKSSVQGRRDRGHRTSAP